MANSEHYIMGIYDFENRPNGIQDPNLEDDGFPLHITLTPPATGRIVVEHVLEEFAEIAAKTEPFTVIPTGTANFGTAESPFNVETFGRSPEIVRLHTELVRAVQALGLYVDETWALDNYNPHSTPLNGVKFDGEPFLLDRFSAIHRDGADLTIYPPFQLGR